MEPVRCENRLPGGVWAGDVDDGSGRLPESTVPSTMGVSPANSDSWVLSRRPDGAIVVRVRSRPNNGHTLPDAVFAFHHGDPQYQYWEQQLELRESKPRV